MSGVSVLRGSLIFRDALRSQERCWLTVLHISYGLMTELWPLVYGTGAGFSRTKHGSLRSQLSFFFIGLTRQYNLSSVLSLKYYYWDFEKRKKQNHGKQCSYRIYFWNVVSLFNNSRPVLKWANPSAHTHSRHATAAPFDRNLRISGGKLGELKRCVCVCVVDADVLHFHQLRGDHFVNREKNWAETLLSFVFINGAA